MPAGIHGVDHSTGIGNLAGLNLYIWNSLLPQMPGLVIKSNFVIKKSRIRSRLGHVHVTPASELLTEVGSGHQIHRAADSPNRAENDPFLHVGSDLAFSEHEIGVIFIVLVYVRNTSSDEGEAGFEDSDSCEFHNMRQGLSELNRSSSETFTL